MFPGVQEQEQSVGSTDLRLEELRKITASQTFAKSPRLCSFLTYIVERSLEGDINSLTEQQIGIQVFNRVPGYNSNDDTIVRGTARSLRQRLFNYYATEGLQDTIRIEIPRGAYVAEFHEGVVSLPPRVPEPLEAASELPTAPAAVVATQTKTPGRMSWRSSLAWVALGIALATFWIYASRWWVESHSPGAPLWNTLFTHDRRTILVPGDAGLNMYEVIEKRTIDLNTYSQQIYRSERDARTNLADDLGARFYTTTSDLSLVSRLVRLPQAARSEDLQISFARDLTVADTNHANLVIIGTHSYNPWVELFQSGTTLKMEWDPGQDIFTVVNLAPRPGEQSQYQWSLKNGTQGGLTLISLTDNSKGGGRVLLIQGTTMGGIFAAQDFLQNEELLNPIFKKALQPDGSLKNFDVLLQSDFIREGTSNLRVLAVHVR